MPRKTSFAKRARQKITTLLLSAAVPLALLASTQVSAQTTIKRISVPQAGTQLAVGSGNVTVSPDGKFAVFATADNTLLNGDTPNTVDFIRVNLSTGAIAPVTLNQPGTLNNPPTGLFPFSSISNDGNFVVFVSDAPAGFFIPGATDANAAFDVFVRNMQNGAYELISDDIATGTPNAGNSTSVTGTPQITPDGRYVVFASSASDLVANDANGNISDVFLYDRQTKTMELISLSNTGAAADASAFLGSVSDDGMRVAFSSGATNLVTNDNEAQQDVFVRLRDPLQPQTVRVSVDNAATPVGGNGASTFGKISGDGRFVAFLSQASNLVGGDTGTTPDIIVRDLTANKTNSFSVGNTSYIVDFGGTISLFPGFPAISKDGRYVAFTGFTTGMTGAGLGQIYFVERNLDTGAQVSVKAISTAPNSATQLGNGHSAFPSITADGKVVVFESVASNLVGDDTNTVSDAFKADAISATDPKVSITASMASAAEPSTNGEFTLTLDTAPTVDLTINYAVTGTATADTDYTTLPGTVTVTAGSTSVKIPVTVKDDTAQESAETVIVTLSTGTGYTVGTPASATVNIADNDSTSPPSAEITSIQNISTNGTIADATGMTAGFIVEAPGRFAILAEGTSGLDPILELTGQFIDNGQVQTLSPQVNDDWNTANGTELQQIIGRQPNNANASVVLMDLKKGIYTAKVTGKNSATGGSIVAINQVVTTTEKPHLRNISTNGALQSNGMTAGFILTDPGRYAILAEGANGLDPILELTGQFVENGQIQNLPTQTSDDWNPAIGTELQQIIGRQPNAATAGALILDLKPGIYNAKITGKNGATGSGIIAVTQTRPATP